MKVTSYVIFSTLIITIRSAAIDPISNSNCPYPEFPKDVCHGENDKEPCQVGEILFQEICKIPDLIVLVETHHASIPTSADSTELKENEITPKFCTAVTLNMLKDITKMQGSFLTEPNCSDVCKRNFRLCAVLYNAFNFYEKITEKNEAQPSASSGKNDTSKEEPKKPEDPKHTSNLGSGVKPSTSEAPLSPDEIPLPEEISSASVGPMKSDNQAVPPDEVKETASNNTVIPNRPIETPVKPGTATVETQQGSKSASQKPLEEVNETNSKKDGAKSDTEDKVVAKDDKASLTKDKKPAGLDHSKPQKVDETKPVVSGDNGANIGSPQKDVTKSSEPILKPPVSKIVDEDENLPAKDTGISPKSTPTGHAGISDKVSLPADKVKLEDELLGSEPGIEEEQFNSQEKPNLPEPGQRPPLKHQEVVDTKIQSSNSDDVLLADLNEETNYVSYLVTFLGFLFVGFLLFHNKKRLLALLIEGRRPNGNGRRRRSSSGTAGSYRKLENNYD